MDCEKNTEYTTTVTGVDPVTLGYGNALSDISKALKQFGEALCIILSVLPSKELSLTWNVSQKCKLEFTVKKV